MTNEGDVRIGVRAFGILVNEGATSAHMKAIEKSEMITPGRVVSGL